jgi:hypothetical protein
MTVEDSVHAAGLDTLASVPRGVLAHVQITPAREGGRYARAPDGGFADFLPALGLSRASLGMPTARTR